MWFSGFAAGFLVGGFVVGAVFFLLLGVQAVRDDRRKKAAMRIDANGAFLTRRDFRVNEMASIYRVPSPPPGN